MSGDFGAEAREVHAPFWALTRFTLHGGLELVVRGARADTQTVDGTPLWIEGDRLAPCHDDEALVRIPWTAVLTWEEA